MAVPLFFHLTLLSFLFSTCSAICYYPDGTTAPQDVPCNDDADHSACCGQGYACLSNGVCMATGDELQKSGASTYVRGSCTDSAWRSSSCPSFCVSPLYDNVAGGNGMGLCEDTSEVLFYCIDMLSYNCTSQENVLLFVDSPSVITTIGVAASSSATSSSSSSMPVPSATPSSISSILSTSTPAAGTVGSSTAALPTASTDPEDSSQPQQGTIIGAAVGASIAGVAAGAAGLWFLLRARKNRRRSTAGNSVDGGPTSDVSAAEHPQKGYWEPPKTEGMPTHLSPRTSELDSTHRSYLASELDSTAMTQSIYELPAWGRENRY